MSNIDIFLNDRELKYSSYIIELHSNKLVNTMQIYTNEDNISIGDYIYVTTKNINPYLTFKITNIIITNGDEISDTLIIASSIESELIRYYTKDTKQFDINTSINTILSYYGFNNIGDNFNLVYTNELNITIGSNLSTIISKILYEHGYFMSNSSKYVINIQGFDTNKNNYNLEFIEHIKESKNISYNNITVYSDNNIRYDNKWTYDTSTISDNNLVYKCLLNTNKDSLTSIANNIKLLELSKRYEIEIVEDTNNIYNLHDSINLAKLFNNIDKSFYIYYIKYNSDSKTTIKLREIIKG